MDPRTDIREFLVSRRDRITPEQAGLPAYGSNRRVKGLRREEVAMLAGISAEYYVRLERGNLRGVSEDVLNGIARALQLDDAERSHLLDLARAANATPGRPSARQPSKDRVRPSMQRILDSFVGVSAFVANERLDVIAANQLSEAFYAPLFDDPVRPVNSARFVFLNRRATEYFADGTGSPTTPSASFVPKPAETRMTSGCPTWSANSLRAARTSASAGRRTT